MYKHIYRELIEGHGVCVHCRAVRKLVATDKVIKWVRHDDGAYYPTKEKLVPRYEYSTDGERWRHKEPTCREKPWSE